MRRHPLHTRRAAVPGLSAALVAILLGACGGESPTSIAPPPPSLACQGAPPDTLDGLPAAFYGGTQGRCGASLQAALHALVRTQRVLGYTFARDSLYAFVDRGNRAVIVDVYAGRTATGVTTRATAAAAGFNTEHTWPRSRGAEQDPALSDLHHLFTSDSLSNSTRSNFPYGLVSGAVLWTSGPASGGEQSRMGYDAVGRLVFEPRPSRRGDLARALYYFYVRYDDQRTSSYSLTNFNQERELLALWSAEDPVDEYERARNRAVQRAQGNRNPFVDYPAFVTRLNAR